MANVLAKRCILNSGTGGENPLPREFTLSVPKEKGVFCWAVQVDMHSCSCFHGKVTGH